MLLIISLSVFAGSRIIRRINNNAPDERSSLNDSSVDDVVDVDLDPGILKLNLANAYETNRYCYEYAGDSASLSTDNYGNVYEKNSVLANSDSGLSNGTTSSEGKVNYFLDGKYKRLNGTIYVPSVSKDKTPYKNRPLYIKIVGDGKSLYVEEDISSSTEPIDFSTDVSDIEFLEIYIPDTGWYRGDGTGAVPILCIANLVVS